jgi:adenosylcobinamide kinase/adenosylcobinamide-phosphate guanylyltransferase
LSRLDLESRVVVVDCVTLWLTNYFDRAANGDLDALVLEVTHEFDATVAKRNTWLFVSNEIGQGVHAPTDVGRRFTDAQGFVNQHIAARADGVVWMLAGLPVVIKGELPGSGSPPIRRLEARSLGDAS